MKPLRHIKHIVMIYNRFEEEKAELLSTFFRLIGTYVLAFVSQTINEGTDLSYKDFVIVINNNGKNTWIERGYRQYNWIHINMEALLCGENNVAVHRNIIGNLLRDMKKLPLGGEFDEAVFRELEWLADVYTSQNLLLYNYHLRLVTVRPEKRKGMLTAAVEHFQKALSQAEGLEESPHTFYFRQECRRKVNLACRLAGRLKYYRAEDLMATNLNYLSRNREFTCLWTLTGLIADEDNDKVYMAVNYYQMHLNEEKRLGDPEDERFQGYSHYRMGRYYERVDINWEKALKCYQAAYRSAPFNYRFTYKVAFAYETLRHDQWAEKYYDIIMEQMEPYIEGGYLTPCKCEYAFKVARRLMLVSMRQGQNFYAKKMAELAIRIWEDIPNNRFIERFYAGDEAKEIKEGMQQRLTIEPTREELEDIEKIIGMYY